MKKVLIILAVLILVLAVAFGVLYVRAFFAPADIEFTRMTKQLTKAQAFEFDSRMIIKGVDQDDNDFFHSLSTDSSSAWITENGLEYSIRFINDISGYYGHEFIFKAIRKGGVDYAYVEKIGGEIARRMSSVTESILGNWITVDSGWYELMDFYTQEQNRVVFVPDQALDSYLSPEGLHIIKSHLIENDLFVVQEEIEDVIDEADVMRYKKANTRVFKFVINEEGWREMLGELLVLSGTEAQNSNIDQVISSLSKLSGTAWLKKGSHNLSYISLAGDVEVNGKPASLDFSMQSSTEQNRTIESVEAPESHLIFSEWVKNFKTFTQPTN